MLIAVLRRYLTGGTRFRTNLISLSITFSALIGLSLGELKRPAVAQVTSTPVGATGASVISTSVATTTSDTDPPYLGVISNATANGAVVSGVVPGSPAAQAGIQAGDVIQAVNGTAVTLSQPLSAFLKSLSPGTQLQLTVLRNGASATVQV